MRLVKIERTRRSELYSGKTLIALKRATVHHWPWWLFCLLNGRIICVEEYLNEERITAVRVL